MLRQIQVGFLWEIAVDRGLVVEARWGVGVGRMLRPRAFDGRADRTGREEVSEQAGLV